MPLILLASSTVLANQQDQPNNPKEISYYTTGEIKKITEYTLANQRYYYKTGELKRVVEYVNDKRIKQTIYYLTGEIKKIIEYTNNKTLSTYYYKTGQKNAITEYTEYTKKPFKMNALVYYPTGELLMELKNPKVLGKDPFVVILHYKTGIIEEVDSIIKQITIKEKQGLISKTQRDHLANKRWLNAISLTKKNLRRVMDIAAIGKTTKKATTIFYLEANHKMPILNPITEINESRVFLKNEDEMFSITREYGNGTPTTMVTYVNN
jgi:hypothetical protein